MRHLKLHIFFLLLVAICSAQTDLSKYPFIRKDLNKLHLPADSSAFVSLYNDLGNLAVNQNIRFNVVHMGGSHVQGGTWSNAFIRNFQNTYITGGGGYFVFPFRLAGTNAPHYSRSFSNGKWKKCRPVGKDFCLPLGMSAMSITTNDSSCYFGMKLTERAVCKFVNVVKVYHNFNPSFKLEAQPVENFTGIRKDHPEQGFTEFRFDVPVDSVAFQLNRIDTVNKDFILFGLSFENDLTAGFFLATLGANGASSNSFMRCADLKKQLGSLDADLYILSLGVNDTQSRAFLKEDYIANYDSLITAIKKASPNAAIILTTTTDNFIRRKTPNRRSITAQEAMFELRDKHNVAVWDLFEVMGGYRSMLRWQKAGLASADRVHFTGRGYAVLGDLMFDAVYRSYLNYKKL